MKRHHNLLARKNPARLNIKKLTKNTSGTYLEPKSADKFFILQTVGLHATLGWGKQHETHSSQLDTW